MTNNTPHDFAETLYEFNYMNRQGCRVEHLREQDIKTIQAALKLADRMQRGDVSDQVYEQVYKAQGLLSEIDLRPAGETIFKAMAAQMLKEVTDE